MFSPIPRSSRWRRRRRSLRRSISRTSSTGCPTIRSCSRSSPGSTSLDEQTACACGRHPQLDPQPVSRPRRRRKSQLESTVNQLKGDDARRAVARHPLQHPEARGRYQPRTLQRASAALQGSQRGSRRDFEQHLGHRPRRAAAAADLAESEGQHQPVASRRPGHCTGDGGGARDLPRRRPRSGRSRAALRRSAAGRDPAPQGTGRRRSS